MTITSTNPNHTNRGPPVLGTLVARMDNSVHLFFFKIFSAFIAYLGLLFSTKIPLYTLFIFGPFFLLYAYQGGSLIWNTRVNFDCEVAQMQPNPLLICAGFLKYPFGHLFQTEIKIDFKTNLIFFPVQTGYLLPV